VGADLKETNPSLRTDVTSATRPARGVASEPPSDSGWFDQAFRQAVVGMALAGLDGKWMQVNDALCRIVGYDRDELLARGFSAITHPDDVDADVTAIARLARGAVDSHEREKRYLHKDGSIVWVHLTVSLVRSPQGAPRFFLAQVLDITRRKRAESEMDAFFDASPDLLAIAGTSGKLDLVNSAWERTLGWTREEVTSRPFLDFVHPEDHERTLAEARAVYEGRPAPMFRNRYRAKDGSYHWLEWRTRPTQGGRLYCVVRDVSLHESEERERRWLASLVESTQDSVIGTDSERNVVSWNSGATRLYGYTAEEMRGQPLARLVPSERSYELEEIAQRIASGATTLELDTVRRRKDGSRVDVHVLASRVEDDQGRVIGWSFSARDITERKRMRSLLEAVIANITDGVALIDTDRRILLANAAYAEMFASDRQRLVGMGEEFLQHVLTLVDDPEAFLASARDPATTSGESTSEFLFVRPRRRYLRRTVKPIGKGAEALYLVMWRDVTAERDDIEARNREVLTDALTGIANRRGAEAALARQLAGAAQNPTPFCVAVVDIDHFKRINDTHGHLAGDDALKRVGSILSAQARASDTVARWGGEEFIAVISAGIEGALKFCERLRVAVEREPFGPMAPVTVSIGVAELEPGDDDKTLIARADRLLYEAKREGRNRVRN
jgi:diguanylate cyclase (GGDEF)-like protein/PAS domain S-box-containing protein